jgi:hypothetical protein
MSSSVSNNSTTTVIPYQATSVESPLCGTADKIQCVAFICTGLTSEHPHCSTLPLKDVHVMNTKFTWEYDGLSYFGEGQHTQANCSECGKLLKYNGTLLDNIAVGRFTLVTKQIAPHVTPSSKNPKSMMSSLIFNDY